MRMDSSRPKQTKTETRKLRLQLGAAPVVQEPLTGLVMGLPTPPPKPKSGEESR